MLFSNFLPLSIFSFYMCSTILCFLHFNHLGSQILMFTFVFQSYCNQKERVRKHITHWLPSTNHGVRVLLIYSTQFRPSETHITLTACCFFQTNITRSKTYKCLAFHTTTEHILQYPTPASPIHTDASKGKLFHYITDHVHSPKAQAHFPIKCSQKH
jgi:hypothetical protein